ncbi:hypothetical protein DVG78_26280 [Runella aurantiaca]|uniref:Uncharacterized protein n=1 Tax=Runella aurantiaca TaxID=2282308 RepID=A0A369I405_9BACT|nr:hypothetical protein DVG78_26280 [Runella aurantiaca]
MEIETDKSKVLDVTHQLTPLMIDRDLVGLNKILDTNFTITHITGYVIWVYEFCMIWTYCLKVNLRELLNFQ